MYFILGYFAGLITTVIVIVVDVYLHYHNGSITDRVANEIRLTATPKAQIVKPPNSLQSALDRLAKDPNEIKL